MATPLKPSFAAVKVANELDREALRKRRELTIDEVALIIATAMHEKDEACREAPTISLAVFDGDTSKYNWEDAMEKIRVALALLNGEEGEK